MAIIDSERWNHIITSSINPKNSAPLAIATAFAALLTYAVVFTVTPASINQIRTQFHASGTQLSYLTGIMMVGFFVACIAGGRIADKHGKILILVIGTFLMSLGAILFFMSPSFTWTFFASMLTGIGGGFSEGMAMAVVSDNTSEKNRTLAMNIAQIVFCVGAVGTPVGVSLLIEHHVLWRWAYAGASMVCAIAFILALVAYKRTDESHLLQIHADRVPIRSIERLPLLVALSIGLMIYVGAECGFAFWIAKFFKDSILANAKYSAQMVSLFWAGIAVGRGITGISSRYLSDEAIVIWAFLSGAIFIGIALLIYAQMTAAVLVLAAGIAYGPSFPTILSVAGSRFKTQTGFVFGVIVASGSMGAIIFPAIIGMSSDLIGLRLALWVCPAISLIGVGIFVKLWAEKRNALQKNIQA